MKKFALLSILLLGIFASGLAANFGISVPSPYLVTEWRCGQDLNIQWSKWGDWTYPNYEPTNQKVRILLRKVLPVKARFVAPIVIAENVPATTVTGKYLWKISNVTNGEYHVIVETMNKMTKGESEVFTIKGCLQKIIID
ncbi:MAG TPA: hypothetical protein VF451_00385 [Acidobacteriota bacterium]